MNLEDTMKKQTSSRVADFVILYHDVLHLKKKVVNGKSRNIFKIQTLLKMVVWYQWERPAEEDTMQGKFPHNSL